MAFARFSMKIKVKFLFSMYSSLREHSFFSWGGGPEEFGGGSSNFDVLQRGGSSYSFGIN